MRVVLAFAAIAAMTYQGHAQGMASVQTATALGSVLAAEKHCGFTYDQAAIAAYVESKVPADDMSFPSTLQMMVQGQEYQLSEMSESSKTAHCTQIARVAKTYNFIE